MEPMLWRNKIAKYPALSEVQQEIVSIEHDPGAGIYWTEYTWQIGKFRFPDESELVMTRSQLCCGQEAEEWLFRAMPRERFLNCILREVGSACRAGGGASMCAVWQWQHDSSSCSSQYSLYIVHFLKNSTTKLKVVPSEEDSKEKEGE